MALKESHDHQGYYGVEAAEQFHQNHLQQPSTLHQQKETQKNLDYLNDQLKEALKAWVESEIKRANARPSSTSSTTNQEPSCCIEESVDQRKETDQPLLVCKGMTETSSSEYCDNEIFISHEMNEPEVYLNLEEAPKYDSYDENEPDVYLDLDDAPKYDSYDENELLCEFDEDSISDSSCEFAFLSLTNPKPVQPNIVELPLQVHEENKPAKAQKEQPICHEPESIPKSLSHDLQKHCRGFDLVRENSNLFVLVSAQEEKQFGLENVKYFVFLNVFLIN